mgnify:FL=1
MLRLHLPRIATRALRALTPLTLSASLIAAGCDTGPQTAPTVELRAGKGSVSPKIAAQADALAKAIAYDEAFVELVELSAGMMGDLVQAQQKLSDEDVDAIAITTTHPSFADVMGPGPLLAHLGGEPADLAQIKTLVQEIRENHQLHSASPADIGYLFDKALQTEAGAQLLETSVGGELAMMLYDPCEQLCINIYTAAATIAVAAFVIAMGIAAVTFPFGIILAQVAVAALNRALAEAQAERDVCIAACDGEIIEVDLCGDADICEDDEYCWTGVLGIGADECRPKKNQGRTCANHEQCLSDCCKLHVWTNPVSKTCRPANAC